MTMVSAGPAETVGPVKAPGNAVRVMSGDSRYHRLNCRVVGEAIAEAEAIAAAEAAAEAAAQALAEAAASRRFGGRVGRRAHAPAGGVADVMVEKTPALEIEDMTMDAAMAEGFGPCGFCRPPIPGAGELPEPLNELQSHRAARRATPQVIHLEDASAAPTQPRPGRHALPRRVAETLAEPDTEPVRIDHPSDEHAAQPATAAGGAAAPVAPARPARPAPEPAAELAPPAPPAQAAPPAPAHAHPPPRPAGEDAAPPAAPRATRPATPPARELAAPPFRPTYATPPARPATAPDAAPPALRATAPMRVDVDHGNRPGTGRPKEGQSPAEGTPVD